MLQVGNLGIHPPGALGVAFFMHAGAECFVGRIGDGITEVLKSQGTLNLQDDGVVRTVPLHNRVFVNLLEAEALGHLPELLMVCCNPNQLKLYTAELIRFCENLVQRGLLRGIEDIRRRVPISLIMPNGILSEYTVDTYCDQLTESMLMDRLPGLDEQMKDALLQRVVRGISLQAGGRKGMGPETIYILERKGMLLFAGGGELEKARVERIFDIHEYPYNHVRNVPGTRIEFDKAMISIVLNVGGLIHTVKPDGELIDLRMGDLCKDPSMASFVEQITRATFTVGRAIRAYAPEMAYDDVWAEHRETIMRHAGHVTSSLKSFRDALSTGLNEVKLFSNEEWLLTPLAQYAAKAGLTTEEALFRKLKRQVQESMARAIHFRDHGSSRNRGANAMKLTAQRNISIESFDAGPDDMILVGTLLDSDHLIKLEMTIHLPDEQITSSRLDMIRVPFPVCREVEAVADSLVGLRIERGVLTEISRRVGGRVGCSHIKELATNIVYFIASYLVRKRVGVSPMDTEYVNRPPEERFKLTRELLRDTCLAYCQTTPLGLDEQMGIKRVGAEHAHPVPLGELESSLAVVLKDRAQRFADKVYIRTCGAEDGAALTWEQFARNTFQISRHLLDFGIRRGDRLCILSENRAEMFMFELASMSIGAVTVPIFSGYPPVQASYVIGHSRPRMLVASGMHQLDKLDRHQMSWIERFYCMDADEHTRQWGALPFADLLSEGGASEEDLKRRIDTVVPGSLCMIMYTSGTTGPPKGVKLCHRNIISQQKAVSLIWDVNADDVFLSYLPWHHSFGGLFERYMTLYNGCELCIDDSRGRDVPRLVDNWRGCRPTLFFSVPKVHESLLNYCAEHAAVEHMIFDGALRFVFTAGAPLPARVEAKYREHGIPVLEGWGLTETSPCVTCTTKDLSWKSGYVGRPIPGVKVRIDSNQEILVKGPNVMLGYLDDEEATSHVITEDGWFRTGDLGEFTTEGLRILGRKDRTFKLSNGEKVHPLRIENLLVNESPYISLALVLGSGQDYVGALIYPNRRTLREWATRVGIAEEGLLQSAQVRELYQTEISRLNSSIAIKYQRIRRALLIEHEPTIERGELTPSSKLVRHALLKNYQTQITDLFSIDPPHEIICVPADSIKKVTCDAG